jgi:hypothetical protein
MNRLFLAKSRRAAGALSLLACVAALSAACTSTGASGPVPTAVGGSGPSTDATGGGAASSASATGSGGSGGIGGSGGQGASSSPAASAHAAGANTCLVRYLNGAIGLSQGAAGTTHVNITFKNLNNEPCTLYGYPGVSLGAGTPVNQVGQPADRDHSVPSKVITLQPGGYAYATLSITDALNYPTASCKPTPTTYLLVYPPNTSNLLYVPYNTNACSADIVTMAIQAVQAGNGGG